MTYDIPTKSYCPSSIRINMKVAQHISRGPSSHSWPMMLKVCKINLYSSLDIFIKFAVSGFDGRSQMVKKPYDHHDRPSTFQGGLPLTAG